MACAARLARCFLLPLRAPLSWQTQLRRQPRSAASASFRA
jgi:hypothetical protein